MTWLRVAAVVVTHNRRAVLAGTLRAIQAQTRSLDRVYVVDNASGDGTPDLLRTAFADATHIRLAENLGSAGGLARGIAAARDDGFDAYWLVDDDSSPDVDGLEVLLAAHDDGAPAGIVGCQGGIVRHGLIRYWGDRRTRLEERVGGRPFPVDFVELDGSIVLREVVDSIGLPRVEYFMMLEGLEYSLRARRAGFGVTLVPRDVLRRQSLGSVPGSALWRGYYQSRNQLRMALDFRSPSLMFGCTLRQLRFISAALRAPDRRWQRIRLRMRGLSDGIRGRMGRNLEVEAQHRGS
jgi:rhamnopyranosyl-N-acetylglucosaminyl-diphospho-decaprenol beta-1,3/1,4-galactofuranosyltransferase